MSEVLLDYMEVNSKSRVVFINDGTIDAESFSVLKELEETIESYVTLDIVVDAETAEQFIIAVSAFAADEGLYDIDDEDDTCPFIVNSVTKFNGQFLVHVTDALSLEFDEDYEGNGDGDDDSDDDENWEAE